MRWTPGGLSGDVEDRRGQSGGGLGGGGLGIVGFIILLVISLVIITLLIYRGAQENTGVFPYEGDGAARWLWVADGVPELRCTEYDAVRAGRRILATGWPDEESVEAALIEPIDPSVVTQECEDIART